MDRLESMRVFVKVASLGSYTRAAVQLDISTALVSRHVSAIETWLGSRLLNRSTRSVSMTESGRIYLERARRIIHDFDETERTVASRSQIPAGKLRIVTPPVFAQQHPVPILCRFRQRYPEVLPELTVTEHDLDIVSHVYDVGILPSSAELGVTMVAKPLFSTPWTICAAKGYLDRHGVPQSPGELVDHAMLTTAQGDASSESLVFDSPWGEVRVSMNPVLVVNDMEVVRRATLCEMGIGILPSSVISRDIEERRLLPLLCDYNLPRSSLQIVFPSKRHLAAKVRTFIDYLTDQFQSHHL
jgi:DNA-binding transcriptional LysR family regulator